jgi:hypothetical protein
MSKSDSSNSAGPVSAIAKNIRLSSPSPSKIHSATSMLQKTWERHVDVRAESTSDDGVDILVEQREVLRFV